MLYGAANPQADDGKPARTDEDIVREAFERWQATEEWQGTEDERCREDIKFANGDARNRWQWPQAAYEARTGSGKNLPCLTINNTRVHNDLIINDMSKKRFGVKVRPTGGKASYKSAETMMKLIRRTQDISKFSTHQRKVAEQQVDGGIGYILIETDYVSERSFDQDIYLRASRDPTGVRLDPWIREPDGSDARFGFVQERMSRREFNRRHPKFKDKVGATTFAGNMSAWIDDKTVTVVKYFRKSDRPDTLVSYTTHDGEEVEQLSSEIKDTAGVEIFKALMEDIKEGRINGKTRKVGDPQVEWFLIAGDVVVKRGKWAGKYIPICRCVGRELVIDGTLDRKGHTRPLINAQHMLNYSSSAAVQAVALGVKSQWIGAARAFEGQEQWKTANLDNFAALMYNDVDDEAPEGQQRIDRPERIEPPSIPQAHMAIAESAERQMMMISGQFQAQMGENDTQSAASGKAIGERQAQGDTATYHFPEHMNDMLRFVGVQLLDLYPKIYDTRRTLQITGEDGEKAWILIDPDQEDAVKDLEDEKEDEEAIKIAFNPKIGEFECVSDPGPDFATERQEAWEAFSTILQQNMALAGVIGDLIFKFGDFPGADEIAERLKAEIKATKPYLFDKEAEPQIAALNQQLQRLTALNGELMQKLALKDIALKGKDEKRDIESFKADTERMRAQIEAVAALALTPQQKAQMEHEIALAGHEHISSMIQQANAAEIDMQAQGREQAHQASMAAAEPGVGKAPSGPPEPSFPMPPVKGARQSPIDGLWYVRHPHTGQHYRVDKKKKAS